MVFSPNLIQTSISVGPLILYIGSFIATIAVKRINKIVGEKVSDWIE